LLLLLLFFFFFFLSSCSFSCLCWATLFQKSKRPSFQISSRWNFDSVIRSRWRHFTQQSAAIWWVYTQRLPGAYAAAFASSWCIMQSPGTPCLRSSHHCQSINQWINHEALSNVATSRLNCYNNKDRQSVNDRSDDEIWIRLSEKPCLEMLTEWRQRLSWRRLLWQGVPDACVLSRRASIATFRHRPRTFLFQQSFPDIIIWHYKICYRGPRNLVKLVVKGGEIAILATLKISDWLIDWHSSWTAACLNGPFLRDSVFLVPFK